ncbi:MAG: DUF2934 domain-containing protein [Leptospiraceae bacterium]|nr:DUF2934 domain-containing protein [Leptospiraceae bacterium]
MPYDITACKGGDCPIKDSCLRFTGVFYGRYDQFTFPPYNFQKQSCESYLFDRPNPFEIQKLAYQFFEDDGYQNGKDLEYWFKAEKFLLELKRKR